MLCAVVFTQYRRVTDGRTDGIAVANTALAMRALRRAVKMSVTLQQQSPFNAIINVGVVVDVVSAISWRRMYIVGIDERLVAP